MKEFERIHECGFLIEKVNLTKASIIEAIEFKNILDQDIREGHNNIIIDLSMCQFIDSSFLGVLVVTWKKLKTQGGRLKLVKPGYFAQAVFHLTGAVEIFESYGSVEEALSSFVTPIQDYINKNNLARN